MAITINRLTEADIPGLHRELRNSLGYLKELGWIATSMYMPFRNHFKQLAVMPELMIFVIRVDGEVAGAVEIEDRGNDYFIGYWLGVRFRRKGIITRCILDILKHDLPYRKLLTARVHPDNRASIRVLERIGMRETNRDNEWVYYEK